MGILNSPICPQCHMAPENTIHLFLECRSETQLWAVFQLPFPIPTSPTSQTTNIHWLYHFIHTPLSSTHHKILSKVLLPFALWHLWIIRNENTFDHQTIPLNIPFSTKYGSGILLSNQPKISTQICNTSIHKMSLQPLIHIN